MPRKSVDELIAERTPEEWKDLIEEEMGEVGLYFGEKEEDYSKMKLFPEDDKYSTCLDAVRTIKQFLETEKSYWGQCSWKDKDGDGFSTDMGYFEEGLDGLEEYLMKKMEDQE